MFKRCVIMNLLIATIFSHAILAKTQSGFEQPSYITDRSLLENLWKKSPFDRKVAPSLDGEPTSVYVMTGFGEIGSKRYASVFNCDTKERLMLSKEPQSGARLVDFSSNADASKTTATIEIDGKSYLVKFDALASNIAPPVAISSAFQPPIQNASDPVSSSRPQPRAQSSPSRRLHRNLKFPILPDSPPQ
jgi:hypothetical protein